MQNQCQGDNAVGDEYAEVFTDTRIAEQGVTSGRSNDEQGVEQIGLMPLVQNEATWITAIIYLNGRDLKNENVLAAGEIQGRLNIDRFYGDMVLEPTAVTTADKATKQDTAEEKRVELHMHTRFSTQDALTDPAALIKRAAKWGHKAVAITDHGCAQAFPDAWHAAEKAGIKVIYGLEGYYINDVDDRLAVRGKGNMTFDGEYIALNLETTGLYARHDTIIEIPE